VPGAAWLLKVSSKKAGKRHLEEEDDVVAAVTGMSASRRARANGKRRCVKRKAYRGGRPGGSAAKRGRAFAARIGAGRRVRAANGASASAALTSCARLAPAAVRSRASAGAQRGEEKLASLICGICFVACTICS